MVRTPQLMVGAIVALCVACAHAPHWTPVEQGTCYTAHIGEWTPAAQPSPRQRPPEVFELLDEVATGMFDQGKTVVRPVIDAAAPYSGQPRAYWSRPSADSLVVTWTNGYEGVRLRLRAGEMDTWTGQASIMTDVIIAGRPRPTAPVDLERVACPEAAPS